MDFDDSFKDMEKLDKNISLDEAKEDEGFGLNEQELRDLETLTDAVVFVLDCRASMMAQNRYNESNLSNLDGLREQLKMLDGENGGGADDGKEGLGDEFGVLQGA